MKIGDILLPFTLVIVGFGLGITFQKNHAVIHNDPQVKYTYAYLKTPEYLEMVSNRKDLRMMISYHPQYDFVEKWSVDIFSEKFAFNNSQDGDSLEEAFTKAWKRYEKFENCFKE